MSQRSEGLEHIWEELVLLSYLMDHPFRMLIIMTADRRVDSIWVKHSLSASSILCVVHCSRVVFKVA